MDYCIFPPEEMPEGIIDLPLSKSISNRVLILNALTGNRGRIERTAECDDTAVMLTALSQTSDEVNIGAAGTAMRFLTAYFAMQPGRTVTITGTERMCNRPIALLVDALRQCGASIEYVDKEGYPPLKIHGCRLAGGDITLPASVSSQYVSALLMVAPYMREGLVLSLVGEMISKPYIMMTLSMMRQWGMDSVWNGNEIRVLPGRYKPVHFSVESDWSAASYWYEIAALVPGAVVELSGLHDVSVQGDSRVSEFFVHLGVETDFLHDGVRLRHVGMSDRSCLSVDLTNQPDLAQTLVVTCVLLHRPFCFTGLQSLKIKETDRIAALKCELTKLGYRITDREDSILEWNGEQTEAEHLPAIDTYDDHRMAMAFAPACIFYPGLEIRCPEVVSKSYPAFWEHLRQAGFEISRV